jgi:hypothetical protein
LKQELFPADECSSVENCTNEVVMEKSADVFMGEAVMKTFEGWVNIVKRCQNDEELFAGKGRCSIPR